MSTELLPDATDTGTDDPKYQHLYPEHQHPIAVCGFKRDYVIGTRDHCPKCPKCLEVQRIQEQARFN